MINMTKVTNMVNISGVLQSIDVRLMSYEKRVKVDGEFTGETVKTEAISGRLKIMTMNDKETKAKSSETVDIFINKLNSNGTLNKTFEVIDQIVEGVKTNDEIKEIKKRNPNYKNEVVVYNEGDENPVKLYCSVWGNEPAFAPHMEENRYRNQEGQVKTNIRFTGGNVTIKNWEEDKHRMEANFKLTGYVKKIDAEITKDGDETGRAKLIISVPFRNRGEVDIMECNVVIGDVTTEDGDVVELGQAVLEQANIGDTMYFEGLMVNSLKITKKEKTSRLGVTKTEEVREFANEMIVEFADFVDDEIEGKLDEEDIADLYKERRIKMDEIANKEVNETVTTTKKGLGMGLSSRTGGSASGAGAKWKKTIGR